MLFFFFFDYNYNLNKKNHTIKIRENLMRQEKYFLTSSLSLLSFLLCPIEAFDYRFSGRVENFSKIGFNNSQINTKKGFILPKVL